MRLRKFSHKDPTPALSRVNALPRPNLSWILLALKKMLDIHDCFMLNYR